LLDRQMRLKSAPHIRFAGQITGCEGYVESASVGMLVGIMTACELAGREWVAPPATTALGALLAHITGDAEAETYQPMNINFGLFPPVPGKTPEGKKQKKAERKVAYTERAKEDLAAWLPGSGALLFNPYRHPGRCCMNIAPPWPWRALPWRPPARHNRHSAHRG
jgi:methylenetetrahydrofolate--tRNA-(uracil-5-)-methyltransferase